MKLRNKLDSMISNSNRGQAMMLIALAFVALVAFIGIAIDAGIVFAHIGHLRRGVDAAALSAANQLRKDWDYGEVTSAAEELILLNLPADSIDDLNVDVKTCVEDDTIAGCSDKRKMAQVKASVDINLAFLPIVGWDSVTINAEAISEAASVDLMLVIDTSTSMAYETDTLQDPAVWDDLGARRDAIDACRVLRGVDDGCMPFENVRIAANNLLNTIDWDYDRVGLVTFDRFAGAVEGVKGEASEAPLSVPNHGLTFIASDITNALNDMEVYPVPPSFSDLCPDIGNNPGNPSGCTRTNTAAGLMLAGKELKDHGRQEALWVVILLSDGVANAAYYVEDFAPPEPDNIVWYCPEDFWRNNTDPENPIRVYDNHTGPWCSSGGYPKGSAPNGWLHSYENGDGLNSELDPEGVAKYWADWVACYQAGQNVHCADSGLGAVIFTIALGEDYTLAYEGPFPDAGEKLLRYIANVGYNGNPSPDSNSDMCNGKDPGIDCGNYYFSKTTLADLESVFSDIADRIFTRLTH